MAIMARPTGHRNVPINQVCLGLTAQWSAYLTGATLVVAGGFMIARGCPDGLG